MLLTPALVLLSIILNFCALLHVTSNWNGLSDKRWSTLDRAVYALEEVAVTAYGNYLDIVAPPPLTTSPVSFPPLHHAEWVYRSSVVRILDLVDGHSRNKSVSDVASRASVSPSPPKPKDPVAPARIPPPGLAPLVHPATFEKIPAYDPSTASMAASSAIRFLGLTGLAFLGYTLIFAWLKNRRRRRQIHAQKPSLTCDVHCEVPAEDFHSITTATSIPSYPGTPVDLEVEASSSHPYAGSFTTPRIFPVVITNPDGQTLFKADLKFPSNRVTTDLSATTSTVSFSVDVVASLDILTVPEWYVPAKEGDNVHYTAEDSLFFLLVRGSSDQVSHSEESQDLDLTSELEKDTHSLEHTPVPKVSALGPDCEGNDRSARDISPLGSPMCPVTIPFHYRGYSAFETALINSGTKARRDTLHKEGCSHRSKTRINIRPKDVDFPWLRAVYNCGRNHLNGCPCEEVLAEHAFDVQHPHPRLLSKISDEYDAIPEFDRETQSEGRGSGVRKQAFTVSSGLSARPEMSPTGIFGPAEPRPTARSDPSFADGKALEGLDSTVALMPPFGVVSPELPLRRRSSGISSPAGFSDGALGEQSMSLEEDNAGAVFTSEFIGTTRFTNGSCSSPSPAAPGRANLLMDALDPILGNHTSPLSPPSPQEAMLLPQSLTSRHLEYSPLQYSPSSVRSNSPVERANSPGYDDWVGRPTEAIDNMGLD